MTSRKSPSSLAYISSVYLFFYSFILLFFFLLAKPNEKKGELARGMFVYPSFVPLVPLIMIYTTFM